MVEKTSKPLYNEIFMFFFNFLFLKALLPFVEVVLIFNPYSQHFSVHSIEVLREEITWNNMSSLSSYLPRLFAQLNAASQMLLRYHCQKTKTSCKMYLKYWALMHQISTPNLSLFWITHCVKKKTRAIENKITGKGNIVNKDYLFIHFGKDKFFFICLF